MGIGFTEQDYYVTGTISAEILAKRYIDGELVEQKTMTYEVDVIKKITIGVGLTMAPYSWYNYARTGVQVIQAIPKGMEGVKHYFQFKDALETIGNNQIIPAVVAEGAFKK